MLDIFRINYENKALYSMIPQWEFLKQGLAQNVKTSKNFYKQEIYHARSDHILMSLIFALNVSRNSDADRVYDNAQARTNQLANLMRMTSAVNRGNVFRNMFFGGNSNEIIFGHASLTSPRTITDDWKNMRPIRILRHPFTDTWGNIPDGKPQVKDGLSFFSVDIPMLALMYWCFQKEQDVVEAGGQPRHTPAQFVYAYCLANMVEDMIDHSFFNRVYALQSGAGLVEHRSLHPFSVPGYLNEIKNGAKVMLERIQNLDRRLAGRLAQMDLIFTDNALELSRLPSIAPTLQCFWALAASRSHMVTFGLQSMGDPRVKDGTNVNLIQWSMNLQKTPQVIKNNMPINAYVHVGPEVDYFMSL